MSVNNSKYEVLELIKTLGNRVDQLKAKLREQEEKIQELQAQNSALEKSNKHTLDQIKDYILELEKIRNHYVSSINNLK